MQKPVVLGRITLVLLSIFLAELLGACNMPEEDSTSGSTATNKLTLTLPPSITLTPTTPPTSTQTPMPTQTLTLTPSLTPTASDTPSPTSTATSTDIPTITPTLTPETAIANAEQNVNCRWGPSSVYLNAGSFPDGATARIDGRNYAASWLWIQMEDFSYRCWVAASAVVVTGDLGSVPSVPTGPPINTIVPPPTGVGATRNGNNVTITWNAAAPAVDLHYLIWAETCDGQYVIETLDTTTNTSYTIQDKPGCSGTSKAQMHVVNKTGYSSPVSVPWP
jgi:uncharacterized protein YraI